MSDYFLSQGKHDGPDDGRCAMEWVSYLAGEPHSDSPACVSTVLKTFCVTLNDHLPFDQRQRIRPYLARTIGTANDGLDEWRQWMCTDWLVRVAAPVFLDGEGTQLIACEVSTVIGAAWLEEQAQCGGVNGYCRVPSPLLRNSLLSVGGLLDRMLPTEIIQMPVVDEWREIVEVA